MHFCFIIYLPGRINKFSKGPSLWLFETRVGHTLIIWMPQVSLRTLLFLLWESDNSHVYPQFIFVGLIDECVEKSLTIRSF